MKKLTPEQRLKVYKRAKLIVRTSVCYAIYTSAKCLHSCSEISYGEYTTTTDNEILASFDELEAERKRRHENYNHYWWKMTNIKIRKDFIQRYLIEEVQKKIGASR